MKRRVLAKVAISAFVLLFGADLAFAQDQYPVKPVILITSGIGGSIDSSARLLAVKLGDQLKQRVIVQNVPGDVERNQRVAHARPDGYTLLYTGENMWVTPLFDRDVGYDAFKDFAPVSLVATTPMTFTVNAALPVHTVKDLIDYSKANPNKLNFASAPAAGVGPLATKLFAHMAGVKIVEIPYTSVSARMTALMGNEVQVYTATAAGAMPFLHSGKVRVIGVAADEPSPLLPGVPVIGDALPNYRPDSYNGLFAVARTPQPIVDRLSQAVIAVMRQPDIRAKFLASGLEPVGSPPDALTTAMRRTVATAAKLVDAER